MHVQTKKESQAAIRIVHLHMYIFIIKHFMEYIRVIIIPTLYQKVDNLMGIFCIFVQRCTYGSCVQTHDTTCFSMWYLCMQEYPQCGHV